MARQSNFKPPPLFEPANSDLMLRIWPDLAQEIGFAESVILLQFEFLLRTSFYERDGRRWIFGSLRNLQAKYFPWLSVATLGRAINRLVEQELLIMGNYNRHKYDRTQWFTLNLTGLARLKSISLCSEAVEIFQNETGISHFETSISHLETSISQPETSISQPETTIHETQLKNQKKIKSEEEVNLVGESIEDAEEVTRALLQKRFIMAFNAEMGLSRTNHPLLMGMELIESENGGHLLRLPAERSDWLKQPGLKARFQRAYQAAGGEGVLAFAQ